MKADLLSAFDALAPHAEVSAALCEAAGRGILDVALDLHSICTRVGLPQARAADVERAMGAGVVCGVFAQMTPLTWRAPGSVFAGQLAPLLRGAQLYRTRVHRDTDVVDVVLTMPPAPSQVSLQLDGMLQARSGFRLDPLAALGCSVAK